MIYPYFTFFPPSYKTDNEVKVKVKVCVNVAFHKQPQGQTVACKGHSGSESR